MPHTITLLKDYDTEKTQAKLRKIALASSVLQNRCETKSKKQPYEVFQAESTLSVEANKIAAVVALTLSSCSWK